MGIGGDFVVSVEEGKDCQNAVHPILGNGNGIKLSETKMIDQPKLIKATVAFNRVTLRKTVLALFDNGIYQVTSKILNKDTLKVHVIRSHFTKPSMHTLASMYLQEFIGLEDIIFEDWVTKSDTLKKLK